MTAHVTDASPPLHSDCGVLPCLQSTVRLRIFFGSILMSERRYYWPYGGSFRGQESLIEGKKEGFPRIEDRERLLVREVGSCVDLSGQYPYKEFI